MFTWILSSTPEMSTPAATCDLASERRPASPWMLFSHCRVAFAGAIVVAFAVILITGAMFIVVVVIVDVFVVNVVVVVELFLAKAFCLSIVHGRLKGQIVDSEAFLFFVISTTVHAAPSSIYVKAKFSHA